MSGTTETDVGAQGAAAVVDPPAPRPDPDVEARARRMGWLPRDQYRGDPKLWQEPDAFVERAETMLPIAVAQNRKLERQVETLTTQMDEAKGLLVSMIDRTRRAEQVGYQRARREIEQERARAVAAGDTEAFNAAEAKLQELGPAPEASDTQARQPAAPRAPQQQQPPAQQPQAAPMMDPVIQAWVTQNPWFNQHPEANAVAVALHGVISQQNPGWSLAEKLAETTRRVRQRMPELFGAAEPSEPTAAANPRRQAAAAVSGSQTAGTRTANPRSFDAMPQDVRREYDRQVRLLTGKGEPLTKDEYARYYWEQFEETV